MDRFERDLATYVVTWIPYGGPTCQDLAEQFGITQQRAVRVLSEMVQQETRMLTVPDRKLLGTIQKLLHDVRVVADGGTVLWTVRPSAAGEETDRRGV